MSRRISIMMDDDAWRVIESLPHSARSRAINAAILDWLSSVSARRAASRMNALRAQLPAVGTDEVVRGIRGGAGTAGIMIAAPDASVLLKWILPGKRRTGHRGSAGAARRSRERRHQARRPAALDLRGGRYAGAAVSRLRLTPCSRRSWTSA